jgi:hypothetical protein
VTKPEQDARRLPFHISENSCCLLFLGKRTEKTKKKSDAPTPAKLNQREKKKMFVLSTGRGTEELQVHNFHE